MTKKQYDKLKSEQAKEIDAELTKDIQQDTMANAKEFNKTDNNPSYDQYLGQLSGNHDVSNKQMSGQFQDNNFLAEEMKEFGLNSRIEEDEDRGKTSLLNNLKTNKTTK